MQKRHRRLDPIRRHKTTAEVEVLDGAPPVTLGNPFRLTNEDFEQLRGFIYQHSKISLSDHKKALVYSRLARRLRHHGFKTYTEYYRYLTESDIDGSEMVEMINAITTNKTSFFRESHHFDFLRDTCFPAMRKTARGPGRTVRMWCAASSTGEEPYTLAMVARDALPEHESWRIDIQATDIDTSVLERARNGVYTMDQMEGVPEALMHKYFLRGKGESEGKAKISPDLQRLVNFQHLNLHNVQWPWREPFDIVFCRNVMIYFNRETQRELTRRLIARIKPGGYLMLGHSEFLHAQTDGVEHLRKNIYRIKDRST